MPSWLVPLLSAGAFLGALVTAAMTALGWRAQQRLAALQAKLGEEVQGRLETGRAEAARALESVRAELALVGRLHTTREEKRAEVAAEVMLAAFDLLDAVRTAAEVVVLQGDPEHREGEEPKEWTRRRHEIRWTEARRPYSRFLRRCAHAEVYLPDSANDVLEKVRKLKRSIQVDQEMYCVFNGGDRYFRMGWGPAVQRQVDAMRAELKQALRPYAQLAGEHPLPARPLPARDGQPAAQLPLVKPDGGHAP